MGSRDWSKFVVRVPVYTDVPKVYDLWATHAGHYLRNKNIKLQKVLNA